MRLKSIAATCLAILFIAAAPAWGGCQLPRAPSKIPDGATATDDDMRAAMRTVKAYDQDVSIYLKCLAFEVSQNRLSQEEAARLHNRAVDLLRVAADRFNEQMGIFRGDGQVKSPTG